VLSGTYKNPQLLELTSKAQNREQLNNLSKIMSDPKFLIGCWVRIRSNKRGLIPVIKEETLDEIKISWFIDTANSIRNGRYKFSSALNDPRNKIVEEAMRQLLEMIYEPRFLECSHGWRSNKGCHTALNDIRMLFGSVNWFIKGNINQEFESLNHTMLVELLMKDIKDQPFIDLIYKYLKIGYKHKEKSLQTTHGGLSQGKILSPILANIYMHQFDKWIINSLIKEFDKGIRKKANPEYTKAVRCGPIKGKLIRPTLTHDTNFKRLRYVRYADSFLIGIMGSKEDCVAVEDKIKHFLNSLQLNLSLKETKIVHATRDSAEFLGYQIHLTKVTSQPIRKFKNQKVCRVIPRPLLDAPIKKIMEKLNLRKYVKTNGNPTKNGRLIHLQLVDLINHYKEVEKGLLTYYSYCSNYGRLAARIHYVLKYSCALTIAKKMKLRTLRKTFKKYGKNLSITNEKNEIVQSYPTISYKKPKKRFKLSAVSVEDLIDNLTNRIRRGRGDLAGPCKICGSNDNIEIHHINHLRKGIKKDGWLIGVKRRMNRKQIAVCQECHQKIHKGTINPEIKLGKYS
jgi:retron-type reverse transcriptase